MEENFIVSPFWGKIEEAIISSRYVDEVVKAIDDNINICSSIEFVDIWKGSSTNFKNSLANRIADNYVEYIINNYCFK